MTISTLKSDWQDTPEYHKHIHELFTELVNADPQLKAHRDFVEQNVWGFGERSFWWLWKVICDEMPPDFSFCEVGVFKGATLSIIKLLRPDAKVFGITPLDSSGIDWEDDYLQKIYDIHDKFNEGKYPHIFHGRSDNFEVIRAATSFLYNIIYIDGSHIFKDVFFDFITYAPQVKQGGYLVIDDCNTEMSMPWGFFQGIEEVTQAKQEFFKINDDFEFVFSVVHISVFRRK